MAVLKGGSTPQKSTSPDETVLPAQLVERIEAYLAEHPAAAVLEDGRVVFDMRTARYSVTESHGRCLLQLWCPR